MLTSSFVFSTEEGGGGTVQPSRGGKEAAGLLFEGWGGEEMKRVSSS